MSCNIKENVIEVFNPADASRIKDIPITTNEEFSVIVNTADSAKKAWNNSTPNSRKKLIKQFRKAIIQHMDLFIETICSETGKKKFEGMLEIYTSVEHMKHTEKLIPKIFKKNKKF